MQHPEVLTKIRHALGRSAPLTMPPVPPEISEPMARLVHSDIGLPELFASRAAAGNMPVEKVSPEDLASRVGAYLKSAGLSRLALPVSPLLSRLQLAQSLAAAGFEVHTWDTLTLDQVYDLDAGITDVTWAIAETGSLVIRPSVNHGRSLSLVPPVHIAIVEPRNCLADLLDLMEVLNQQGPSSNITIITGPSKTADIEGTLVVGVHGPGVVQIFLLQ